MFVTLHDTRKIGPKTFVIVKTAIFRNICFYRYLGLKEMILSIAEMLSKYFPDP